MSSVAIIAGLVIAGIMVNGVFAMRKHLLDIKPAFPVAIAAPVVVVVALWIFGEGVAQQARQNYQEELKGVECSECQTLKNLWMTDRRAAIQYLQFICGS